MLAIPSDINWQTFLPGLQLPGSVVLPRSMTWREHIAAGLILLAQKLVGFANEEDFSRVAAATRRSETDVGTNRVPRGESPIFAGFDFYFGKTSGAIAKGATNGTVTIWDSATDATAVAATSATLTSVYNPFASVADVKFVLVIQLPWAFCLAAAEC